MMLQAPAHMDNPLLFDYKTEAHASFSRLAAAVFNPAC